jgi:hypothetical protein
MPGGGAREGYEKFARPGLAGVTGLTGSFVDCLFMGFWCSTAGETEDSSTLCRILLLLGIGGRWFGSLTDG